MVSGNTVVVDRRVKEVLTRLSDEWQKRQSVPELAASVNLGASRLAHLVKSTTATSIRELLRRRRLTEAAHLLIHTHQRISEISHYVGFGDVSNFNHAFRREFGISPREYRRRHEDEPSSV